MGDSNLDSGKRFIFKDHIHKMIHPLMLQIFATQKNIQLYTEGQIPEKTQCIFITNHYCIHDIPTVAKIIKRHFYVLVSDEDKNTIDGFALNLNGTIWIKRTDKKDRQRANQDMILHLQAGHNLLMFPEATWNLTANLPMLPLNWGIIKLSKATGVPICPIYQLFCGRECYAKIGELFFPQGNDSEDIIELRDRMSTLFWDLLEKQPQGKRVEIPYDAEERSIRERYDEYDRAKKDPVGVRAYESQFIYKPKGVVDKEEAFSFLQNITPSVQNSYLFTARDADITRHEL